MTGVPLRVIQHYMMQQNGRPQKELYDVKTFLDVFSVSKNKFYSEVARGALRLTKIGFRSYITKQDSEAWVSRIRDESINLQGGDDVV